MYASHGGKDIARESGNDRSLHWALHFTNFLLSLLVVIIKFLTGLFRSPLPNAPITETRHVFVLLLSI